MSRRVIPEVFRVFGLPLLLFVSLPSTAITLDFEELSDREVLNEQYSDLGIKFNNTATVLSRGTESLNYAQFPPYSGDKVAYDTQNLSGGVIPVTSNAGTWSSVSARVTGNTDIALTAYKADGNVVGTDSVGGANYVDAGGGFAPNRKLSVDGDSIHSVEFTGDTSGNSYTIDDFKFTPSAQPAISLDFNGRISRRFYVKNKYPYINVENDCGKRGCAVTYDPKVKNEDGSTPKVGFTKNERQKILHKTQNIFARSGINIPIIDHPVEDALIVRFGPALKDASGNVLLAGTAFDTVPDSIDNADIDRFNLRKDGEVAAFYDPDKSLNALATTIAHEVAHGLGARHVNPLENNSLEVMDYDVPGYGDVPSDMIQLFSSVVSRIKEPPKDGTAVVFPPSTHNPSYHLRHFGAGETSKKLETEESLPVRPGSWETGVVSIVDMTLDTFDLTSPTSTLYDVSLVRAGDAGGLGIDSSGSIAKVLTDVFNPTEDDLDLRIADTFDFDLFASSTPNGIADIFLDFKSDKFSLGEIIGDLLKFDQDSERFLSIGSFSGGVTPYGTARPEGIFLSRARSVPAPPITWMFFC